MTVKASSHAYLFVLVSMLIDSIGFGIILPVVPQLIMDVAHAPLAEATRIGGWLLVVFAALQFVCGPFMGNLSDRYGRRPVLLFSMLCFGLDYLLMAVAPSLAWLFVGRALAGISGAMYGPAYAFLADVTPPDKRAEVFGYMGAAFGMGFILGPAIGGFIGEFGVRAPFYAAAALAGINFIYGYFVLPESLTAERRRPFTLSRANPIGTWRALQRYPGVTMLALAILMWQIGHQVYPSTWSFYAAAKFNWSTSMIGLSLMYTGVLMSIIQAGLTGRVVAALGERRAVFVGILIGATGFLGYAFATEAWHIYAIMTFAAFQGIAYPSMNAMLSKRVPADEQGELQGGMASIASVANIAGPLLMTQTLAYFTQDGAPVHFPGAAFALAAMLATCALIVVAMSARQTKTAAA